MPAGQVLDVPSGADMAAAVPGVIMAEVTEPIMGTASAGIRKAGLALVEGNDIERRVRDAHEWFLAHATVRPI